MKLIFPFAIVALACAIDGAQAASSPETPCSPGFANIGVYRNVNFGFTMTIPRGLKATWSSPACNVDKATNDCVCMNDHGRSIALPEGGTIDIYAEHNALASTLPTMAFNDLEDFKATAIDSELSVVAFDRIRWKAMPAYHYIARTERDGHSIVRESVVVAMRSGDDVLVLSIEAPQKQYDRYRYALSAMLRSWRSSPIR